MSKGSIYLITDMLLEFVEFSSYLHNFSVEFYENNLDFLNIKNKNIYSISFLFLWGGGR